jgi:hypothetical protein
MSDREKSGLRSTTRNFKNPILEQVYIVGSLGNMLTWGDQPILKPMDEVADIHAIA